MPAWSAIVALTCAPAVMPLSRGDIVTRALAHAAPVQVAQARLGEAQALHVGADALASSNPDLSVVGGPDFTNPHHPTAEVMVTLQWPFDVVNTRGARQEAADAAEQLAHDDLRAVQRTAVADALAQALSVRWAAERASMVRQRAELDADFLRITRLKRDAGTVGDADVALAEVLAAESRAHVQEAQATHEAAEITLRQMLGFQLDAPLTFADAVEPPITLGDALQRLPARADLLRDRTRVDKSRQDAVFEKSMGSPQPQLYMEGGRMPEWYAEIGVNVALPIYQRNQTARAVAKARVNTAARIMQTQRSLAEAEVRAAYATYIGTQAALERLQEAAPAIDDAAHLAARAYELGQSVLAQVVVTRRETLTAQLALLDAGWAAQQARLSLELAAGMVP